MNEQNNGACPNCGYCPHCGRGKQLAPVYPLPMYPSPWWQATQPIWIGPNITAPTFTLGPTVTAGGAANGVPTTFMVTTGTVTQ